MNLDTTSLDTGGRHGAVSVALIGMVALASAMGVGRFAFTPLMPLMQANGSLGFGQGAWLASANYLGYLLGALACSVAPPAPRRAACLGLVGVAVFTLAMGVTASVDLWLAFRFAAGVASACVLVGVSAWALPALSRLGRSDWSGWVFSGVGVGITAVGAVALATGVAEVDPANVWIALGAISAAVVASAWATMRTPAGTAVPAKRSARRFGPYEWRLILCYGTFGFGYIIPATFLPAMARDLVNDPAVFGWTWPFFGAVAAASTVVAARALRRFSPRRIWIGSLIVMTVGVLAPVLVNSVGSLLLAALCVGGTFMVITMAGMLEARRQSATDVPRLMAAMTAAFATGQLLGPVLVGLSATQTAPSINGPSWMAAACLLASAWMLRERQAEFTQPTP